MESFALLLLSALISLLIHVAFRVLPALPIGKKQCSITYEHPFVGLVPEKNANRNGSPARIFVRNTLARWPWPRRVNTNYSVVKKDVDTWISSFQAFTPKAQDAFIRCNLTLLACLLYPLTNKEHARAGGDFMHFLFLFDEYSDKSTPSEVRKRKEVVMDAFRNPHTPRPKNEWIGGEVARQFWERAIQDATPISQKRFIQYMDEYCEAVARESIDRVNHRVLDVKDYMDLRRFTVGVKPACSIYELGFDIPDDVMAHPVIQEMVQATVDLVIFCNDIFSYNLEQSRGDDFHNVITCVMDKHQTDVNGALLWVEDNLQRAADRFHVAFAALPEWEEPLNSQVRAYCDGLGQFVRGNNDWSFESERYFGDKGVEIMEKGWMSLLPKKYTAEVGPVHIDSSLL